MEGYGREGWGWEGRDMEYRLPPLSLGSLVLARVYSCPHLFLSILGQFLVPLGSLDWGLISLSPSCVPSCHFCFLAPNPMRKSRAGTLGPPKDRSWLPAGLWHSLWTQSRTGTGQGQSKGEDQGQGSSNGSTWCQWRRHTCRKWSQGDHVMAKL